MKGPARFGAVVYARDLQGLADFYRRFFDMTVLRATPELVSLEKEGFNVVIHVSPVAMPEGHFNAVKLFMTVDSLAAAREAVVRHGGSVMAGEWRNPLFSLCNIVDPEGNPIQIREFSR
ncbi:MAG: VOC family protein [Rhodocyclaceae bacterium]|nr:VOC family protein [Rhodocyclaceae bacterium]